MKALPLCFLPFLLYSLSIFGFLYPEISSAAASEAEVVEKRALSAAKAIEVRLSRLEDRDFFSVAANLESSYGKYLLSPSATYIECLRSDLRAAFAEIELAKQYPGLELSSDTILDIFLSGKRGDFFGSEGHLKNQIFLERSRLLRKLVEDKELAFADRLFLLSSETNDTSGTILKKWHERSKFLASEGYLANDEKMSVSQQAECVRTLFFLSLILESKYIEEAAVESPEVFAAFQSFLSEELKTALQAYSRKRFVKDGPLRDRSLPLLSAGATILPDLTFESVGVTTHQNYKKLALAHARGLAALVDAIDAPMADTNFARRSIGQIIDYRVRPFYLGSTGIREKGALPCEPGGELDMILTHADFFGEEGHFNGVQYRKRVQVLEQLFLKPSSSETLDYLLALKEPKDWLAYFKTKISGEGETPGECVAAIEKGEIEPIHLKNLFLSRCILSHSAFDTTDELRQGRDSIKAKLREIAPDLAVNLFKTMPDRWNQVDLAFVEISKLVPGFELESLSIPTYESYLNQRKDYEWAIQTLPTDLLSLSEEASPDLFDNEVGLFQSDYVYRNGKFNKRLSPEFVKKINGKLNLILNYRQSQFSPPDNTRRPGLEKTGAAMRELLVVNRNYPDDEPDNPQLHDLLEGPDGGFGGLGQLFNCDPKGYESLETALDAIASTENLKLGDALFNMALDVGIEKPTAADKAAAARKWLNYFKKTQSIARFHSTPHQLTEAIRGAYICRLVVQSDDFVEAVERSPEVAVGSSEDVSSVLENTLSSQVRVMNSILSSVDPSTALNKDINHIKSRWYNLKAWHTESIKWLESVVADPSLMSEVSRIRSLSREKDDSYRDIAPVISRVEETLAAVEPRIVAERHSDRHDELFKPLDFANLVMGQLVTLERKAAENARVEPEVELSQVGAKSAETLSQEITHQLFLDIRESVSQAGFEDLSQVNSLTEFPSITRAYYENVGFRKRSEDAAIHELLLHQLKGAIAKAKGRIEAERVTDLNQLEDLTIRASRADRIFFAGDPERYSLLIDPSFLLHEWNNRHKIETIAEFRTVETRAQAQTQIFRFRKEREKLEAERKTLAQQQEELEKRLELARKWADDNNYDFDPDSVIDQMLAMEDKINSLQGDITGYQKMEEKYRQHHLFLAQQLHSYKMGDSKFNREKTREYLLAQAKIDPLPDPEPDIDGIIEKPPPKKTYSKPKTTYRKPTTSRSSSGSSSSRSRSSGGGFFQRLFGGRR
ncbi:MAG: hypothetical protein P1U89_05335 [Verrucomicrobiales bacterium]|nr:hypothetical protein [Verrucomicrobiales bacterium]